MCCNLDVGEVTLMQYIQLNSILKNRYSCDSVVSRKNSATGLGLASAKT